MARYLSVVIVLLISVSTFAQLPQQLHIGFEKILNFKCEPPNIVDGNISVWTNNLVIPPFEYLDSLNSQQLTLFNNDVISVADGKSVGKMPENGAIMSVCDDFVFYGYGLGWKTTYILENFVTHEKIVIDSFITGGDGNTPDTTNLSLTGARIWKNSDNQLYIVVNGRSLKSNRIESSYIILYLIENGKFVSKYIHPLRDEFTITDRIRSLRTKIFDISPQGVIAFSFFSQISPNNSTHFSYLCTAKIIGNSLKDFNVIHRGGVYGSEHLIYINIRKERFCFPVDYYETMKFSPNDSFLYGIRSHREKVGSIDIYKQIKWGGYLTIDRFGGANFTERDSVRIDEDIELTLDLVEVGKEAYIGPNGDLYFTRYWNDARSYTTVIHKPNRDGNLLNKIDVKAHSISSVHPVSTRYFLPQSNKNYIKLRFLKGKSCTDGLRLFADADTFYKEFHWFVANDSGGFDSSYGKNLYYPVKGQRTFYVKMKGIAANGYFAWYSDSFSFNTNPKVAFTADTSAWCQWVGLKMKNLSYSENALKNDFTWQVMKGDTIENTFKGTSTFISFGQTGKYAIRLIYNDGYCTDTFTQTAAINIIEAPKPGFTLSDSIVCDGDQVTVTDESEGRITSRKFTWSDGFTDNSTGHSRRFELPGYYKLKQSLRGPTGCVTGDSAHVRVRAGVDESAQPEMLTANVLDSQTAEIRWKAFANASYYDLLRNDGVKYTISNPKIDSLLDSNLFTSKTSYQYHLQAVDSCGRTTMKSSPATTILLESENQNNEYVILEWNAYEKWAAGVSNYQMEYSEDQINWQTLDNPVTLDYRFTNDKSADSLYFRIIAKEKDGNQQTSVSNIVKERFTSTLFIPNAFSPNGNGLNDVFQIKGYGIETIDCTIWARNGQYLHHSTNPENLWDGTRLGEKLGPGAYFYQFKATTVKGKEIYQNGVLVLVE